MNNSVTREIDSDLEAPLREFAELADKENIAAGITNGLKDRYSRHYGREEDKSNTVALKG